MAGCRALKKDEIVKILKVLKTPRDRAFFQLGLRAGFRVSEILSIQVPDIYQFGQVTESVRVQAMYMKGGHESREVPLHADARQAVKELIETFPPGYNGALFKSREGSNKAISRKTAHDILKTAFNSVGLTGKLASHSLRKTYARRMYAALNFDIYKTAQALGHRSISSTASYLAYDQDEINKAILLIG